MQSISVGPAMEMGSVTPRCCPFAGIPGRPAAAMKRGSRERGEINPPKPQHEERRDQQIKLHRRSLDPVRPSVRPYFLGRSRSPARLVKRRKRRINTKTHTKRHSKAPSCYLPRTTVKSDTKVAANRETSGAGGAARRNKEGQAWREKTQKRRLEERGATGRQLGGAVPSARETSCMRQLTTGWLLLPPPQESFRSAGQHLPTRPPGDRLRRSNLEVPRLKRRSLASLRWQHLKIPCF